jgi:hypothetical protein
VDEEVGVPLRSMEDSRLETDLLNIDTVLKKYEKRLFAPVDCNGDVDEHNIHIFTFARLTSCLGLKRRMFASGTEFETHLNQSINVVSTLRTTIDTLLKQDVTNRGLMELFERVRRVQYTLQAGRQLCLLMRCVIDNCVSRENITAMEGTLQISDQDVDGGDLSRYQQLLVYLLSSAQQCGYTKNGDTIYERVRDRRTGRNTCAWKPVCTIQEFVYRFASREKSFAQWVNMTHNANNASSAANYLQHCEDQQLPKLQKDRHLFAFADGVYVSSQDTFYTHDKVPNAYSMSGSARYFDVPFPFQHDVSALVPADIETPIMQSILNYQNFDATVSAWMYILFGRLLYELGEKDNWQVVPFCMGMAQSGKSTLLMKVCANFFESTDVGVLSNNIEKKFGISGFSEKSIFIAPEINESIQLDQAEFQSLVSGDMMQIAKKHRDPHTTAWKVPGILAGNQMPGWRDTAGSIIRRIIIFNFVKTVVEVDTQLGAKLQNEVPELIVKCNKAYLNKLREIGSQNIWKCLPEYFLQTSMDLQECVNSLLGFMNSGELTFAEDLYMPWNKFQQEYRQYCTRHGVIPMKLTKSSEHTITATLQKKNCVKHVSEHTDDMPYPPRQLEYLRERLGCKTWLKGADLSVNCSGY